MSGKFGKIFNLILTLIVIGLMGALYFFHIRQAEEPEQEAPPSPIVPLIMREESDLREIIYTHTDGTQTFMRPYTDERGRIQWEYSGGYGYTLSPPLLREKANPAWLLAASERAFYTTEDLELHTFGLEQPALTIESVFTDGTSHILKLGDYTPDRRFRFAMFDDTDGIYLINANLAERMEQGAAELLCLSLPHMSFDDAVYISVTQPHAPPVVLGLRGDIEPAFIGDESAVFTPDSGATPLIMHEPHHGLHLNHARMLEYFIAPLHALRLNNLVTLNPANLNDYGLEEPSLIFTFRTHTDELTISFGDTFTQNNRRYIFAQVATRPHVFAISYDHAEILFNVDPMQIAQRAFALINITEVQKTTLSTQNAYFTIEMNHTADKSEIEPAINGIPIEDCTPVRRIFANIIMLSADAEISPLTPADPPETVITHHTDTSQTVLHFYNYNPNFYAVSINGGEIRFVTNRRAVQNIFSMLENLIK